MSALMRILIVEDDHSTAALLQTGLQNAGYTALIATDGLSGLEQARNQTFQLIILDVMLPGIGGIELCRMLRAERITVPILMLTALGAVDDRVRGLDAGADDYLAKPFDFREVLARVRALSRRDSEHKGTIIRIADLEIDTQRHTVSRAGTDIALTLREYELLCAMAQRESHVFTRDAILNRVWACDATASNVVDVCIRSIRRKVDDDHQAKLIHTIWGVGYCIRRPEGE